MTSGSVVRIVNPAGSAFKIGDHAKVKEVEKSLGLYLCVGKRASEWMSREQIQEIVAVKK